VDTEYLFVTEFIRCFQCFDTVRACVRACVHACVRECVNSLLVMLILVHGGPKKLFIFQHTISLKPFKIK